MTITQEINTTVSNSWKAGFKLEVITLNMKKDHLELIFLDAFQCMIFPGYPKVIATLKSSNGKELEDAGADYIINSIDELIEITNR